MLSRVCRSLQKGSIWLYERFVWSCRLAAKFGLGLRATLASRLTNDVTIAMIACMIEFRCHIPSLLLHVARDALS